MDSMPSDDGRAGAKRGRGGSHERDGSHRCDRSNSRDRYIRARAAEQQRQAASNAKPPARPFGGAPNGSKALPIKPVKPTAPPKSVAKKAPAVARKDGAVAPKASAPQKAAAVASVPDPPLPSHPLIRRLVRCLPINWRHRDAPSAARKAAPKSAHEPKLSPLAPHKVERFADYIINFLYFEVLPYAQRSYSAVGLAVGRPPGGHGGDGNTRVSPSSPWGAYMARFEALVDAISDLNALTTVMALVLDVDMYWPPMTPAPGAVGHSAERAVRHRLEEHRKDMNRRTSAFHTLTKQLMVVVIAAVYPQRRVEEVVELERFASILINILQHAGSSGARLRAAKGITLTEVHSPFSEQLYKQVLGVLLEKL